MKGEIDRDFYCSVDHVQMGEYEPSACYGKAHGICESCSAYHRKYPAPEQYKEEYGKEYPEDWAVYFTRSSIHNLEWDISRYGYVKAGSNHIMKELDVGFIVCACTPGASRPITGGRNDLERMG